MKNKTTYLFKFDGAWSPLWNLSDEKFFELKSKDSILFLDMAHPSQDFMCLMNEVIKKAEHAFGHVDKLDQLQSVMGQGLQNIQFSAYHDPLNFGCTTDASPFDKQNIHAEISILIRANEIFGAGYSPERADFIDAMLNHSAVMVRRTNFHCRITPL